MGIFENIFHNNILGVSIVGYLVAQIMKVGIVFIEEKKLDFRRFVGTGGMPSSHAAFVMALSTGIGIVEGFDSNSFAICLCFALVVMYDASGIRRAAGEQAKILNKLVEGLYENKNTSGDEIVKHLKELLGHTPFQVIVGAIIGIATALLLLK